MKVLIINDFASIVGGAERFLENMINESKDAVDFYRINIQDIVKSNETCSAIQRKFRRIAINIKLIKTLEEKIKELNPDIIHLNNNNLYTNSVTRCLNNSKVMVICFIHDHCALNRLHRIFYPYFSNHFIFLTHSADVYRQLLKIRKYVFLVKVPFDHTKWLRPIHGNTEQHITDLLYVGRIEKKKGIFKLIKAVEIIKTKIPSITLTFIGDGSKRFALEKIVMAKNLSDNVIIKGLLCDEEIKKHYYNSKIFIFPSATETLGYVGLEAQSCGLPVITFQNSGSRRWCQDNQNGFIVQDNSAVRLARKVIEIFYDDDLLTKVSSAAKHNVLQERYNASECEIADVYNAVLA